MAKILPEGIYLKIYDAYRPLEKQKEAWKRVFKETRKEKHGLSEEEIKRLTRLKVADTSFGEYGGHQTGGAIDITLCNKEHQELEMGTKVAEYNEKTKTKNSFLSEEARRNRKLLGEVMIAAGFKNFPGEWWHFSYGDKLWAAYSGKNICFYGFITKPAILIRRGDIADGLNDIARYLGLNPKNVIFVHSIANPNDKIEINPPIYRHAQILSYLPRRKEGAKALILYAPVDLLNYLDSQKIAPKNNLIQIAAKPKIFVYPNTSVVAQFCKAVRGRRKKYY